MISGDSQGQTDESTHLSSSVLHRPHLPRCTCGYIFELIMKNAGDIC